MMYRTSVCAELGLSMLWKCSHPLEPILSENRPIWIFEMVCTFATFNFSPGIWTLNPCTLYPLIRWSSLAVAVNSWPEEMAVLSALLGSCTMELFSWPVEEMGSNAVIHPWWGMYPRVHWIQGRWIHWWHTPTNPCVSRWNQWEWSGILISGGGMSWTIPTLWTRLSEGEWRH